MIHLKLTIMAFLWAGGFIAGKFAILQAGPFTISFFRFLIATMILFLLAKKTEGRIKIGCNGLDPYIMCGLFGRLLLPIFISFWYQIN